MKMSLVVPCYNEEEAIPIFYREALKVIEQLKDEFEFEFCFVDDGSKDGTLQCFKNLRVKDERVHYVSFSRNFGKESALYAGLQLSTGDYVATLDVDLQDPPSLLPEMWKTIKESEGKEDYDCVATRRVNRAGEPPIRSFFARMFYKIINKISKAQFVDGASDFRMLSRAAVNALLEMKEYNRFSKGIFGWIGFKTKWIPYENVERVAGETKWSFWKLLLYSLEGFVAFSTAALSIASVMGIVFCLIAFVWMVWIIIKTVVWGETVAGFPTLACLILLIGGSIQLSLGIIGQYLAKTYLETKHRPIYIVAETNEDYHEDTTI